MRYFIVYYTLDVLYKGQWVRKNGNAAVESETYPNELNTENTICSNWTTDVTNVTIISIQELSKVDFNNFTETTNNEVSVKSISAFSFNDAYRQGYWKGDKDGYDRCYQDLNPTTKL